MKTTLKSKTKERAERMGVDRAETEGGETAKKYQGKVTAARRHLHADLETNL